MRKKLVVWDFDGVIVDSRALALQYTQAQFHDVTEDMHRNLFNGNIFDESAKLKRKFQTQEEHDAYLEKSIGLRRWDSCRFLA